MKRKAIERIPAKKPVAVKAAAKRWVTAQVWEQYLVLDLWEPEWKCRHVMDTATGEYGTFVPGSGWNGCNLENAFSDIWTGVRESSFPLAQKDKEIVKAALKCVDRWDIYLEISSIEQDYGCRTRAAKEARRLQRIQDFMDSIPAPGPAVFDWLAGTGEGDRQYAFLNKMDGSYHCTACGGGFAESQAGTKFKHRRQACCPLCGAAVTVDKRSVTKRSTTHLTMFHKMDCGYAVERYFLVEFQWSHVRTIRLSELVRHVFSGDDGLWSGREYYSSCSGWDDKHNYGNLSIRGGYLYPECVKDGLAGTRGAPWAEVFYQMAQAKIKAYYDDLMRCPRKEIVRTAEYLLKGRFARLLSEMSGYIRSYGYYGGFLNLDGRDIESVMGLQDRQKINRLRQEDGGLDMLGWLQWAEKSGKKASDEVVRWFRTARISSDRYCASRAANYLTPEKLMHYLERRKKEEFPKNTFRSILDTYEDYLAMAERIGKNMADEMVYRPRELKRRHREAVEECQKIREAERLQRDKEKAEEEAGRMREKYPRSEEVLEAIRPKYEYADGQYMIVVPSSFLEITMEGMALHHCVGHTERYFDRILSRETYICFLRRAEEPEKPFYTIEVEPGGTIRQHRGEYDEEPGIEEIKPFLRQWQKEVRRRMSAEDHEYAKASAVKRELNMEELRQKNNTRVIEALLEDLMEVG